MELLHSVTTAVSLISCIYCKPTVSRNLTTYLLINAHGQTFSCLVKLYLRLFTFHFVFIIVITTNKNTNDLKLCCTHISSVYPRKQRKRRKKEKRKWRYDECDDDDISVTDDVMMCSVSARWRLVQKSETMILFLPIF